MALFSNAALLARCDSPSHTLVSLAPCASFTTHCCRLPSKQKQPSFSATHHTESRFLLFWMCGEAHLPSEAAQSPKWATWFCCPFQYTPFLYVLSLGLLLRKSTRSFLPATLSFAQVLLFSASESIHHLLILHHKISSCFFYLVLV